MSQNSKTHVSLEDFAVTVCAMTAAKLGSEYQVKVQKVRKVNNVVLTELLIRRDGSNAAPGIPLNGVYEDFVSGEISVLDAAESVVDFYNDSMKNIQAGLELEFVLEFDKVKNRIHSRLLRKDANEELLKEAPYKEFFDMVIVHYIDFYAPDFNMDTNTKESVASALVTTALLEKWGISADELHDISLENTINHQSLFINRISDAIMQRCLGPNYEMLTAEEKEEIKMLDESMPPLYRLTTESQEYGAITMVYPGLFKKLANISKTDILVILPCSVDEIFFVPVELEKDTLSDREDLLSFFTEMMKDLTHVIDKESVLSDHAYLYDAVQDKIIY